MIFLRTGQRGGFYIHLYYSTCYGEIKMDIKIKASSLARPQKNPRSATGSVVFA